MDWQEEQIENRKNHRAYQHEFARMVAKLRPWVFWVTLEYRDPYYGTEPATNNHLFKWAKACQPHLKGNAKFEYAFIPEHYQYETGQFDHLHGLLYVEPRPSNAKPLRPWQVRPMEATRILLTSSWTHGYSLVAPVKGDEFGQDYLARYMAKDFSVRVPFFFSPSLFHHVKDQDNADASSDGLPGTTSESARRPSRGRMSNAFGRL